MAGYPCNVFGHCRLPEFETITQCSIIDEQWGDIEIASVVDFIRKLFLCIVAFCFVSFWMLNFHPLCKGINKKIDQTLGQTVSNTGAGKLINYNRWPSHDSLDAANVDLEARNSSDPPFLPTSVTILIDSDIEEPSTIRHR